MHTTQTAHTQGPWMIMEDADGEVSIQTETLKICTVGFASVFPIAEADARLIASAPDLLEALKACQVRLFMLDGSGPEYQQAGRAIDHAEGRGQP